MYQYFKIFIEHVEIKDHIYFLKMYENKYDQNKKFIFKRFNSECFLLIPLKISICR